ncbi:MAG: alanyl-tRNA synthetase [Parcubacteria group bacterium Gr01-1014_73]|nr:MAG: alanyl-tRNA synthetase [Parcubacteria group bacterium Gr01-1014_73]
MNSAEIRRRFLEFFEKRGHKIIPSASLITPDEKGITNTTLFNSAGMQPLIPYLLGKSHPLGRRLVNVQKCLRTVDIDEVGDATHATFFEMLGNWSLGDYFKEEAIKWSFELLTDKKDGFGLDPKRLYVTVFEGDKNISKDTEAYQIWKKYLPENRIYFLPAKSNWWAAGDNGPCGPDTEMFYDVTKEGLGDMTKEQYLAADGARKVVEVWNDVFMEYEKRDGKVIGKLPQKNVDTGAGLERLAMVLQGVNNIYDTDIFAPIMRLLNDVFPNGNLRDKRVIVDHIRSAVFIIVDGVIPSNTDRGYILRRLIRRTVRFGKKLGLNNEHYKKIINSSILPARQSHSGGQNTEIVGKEFLAEVEKFEKTIDKGLKEFEKGTDPFVLFTSYGFPIELTMELAKEKGVKIDLEKFQTAMKKHQKLSRAGAEQKFKGGLADESEPVVKYHTTTHLLHQALHEVLGDKVSQKGSNITAERLRFDFVHSAKMTDEEKKKVEEIVNQKITENLPVQKIILPKEKALQTGAYHSFNEKYGDEISVYYIGENLETAFSKEFCGGPHVARTGVLGKFKIIKEEAVAAGIRRIKAVLE